MTPLKERTEPRMLLRMSQVPTTAWFDGVPLIGGALYGVTSLVSPNAHLLSLTTLIRD